MPKLPQQHFRLIATGVGSDKRVMPGTFREHINGVTDMTDLNTLTKPALNDMLAKPLTASALKKIYKADLVAMVEAHKPKARKPRELPDRVST